MKVLLLHRGEILGTGLVEIQISWLSLWFTSSNMTGCNIILLVLWHHIIT